MFGAPASVKLTINRKRNVCVCAMRCFDIQHADHRHWAESVLPVFWLNKLGLQTLAVA